MDIRFTEPRTCCPVCGDARLVPAFQLDVKGARINWDRCAACRLHFQNPRLELDSIRATYASDEYWGKGSAAGIYVDYEKYDSIRVRQSQRRLGIITRVSGIRGGELLDVGCATGFFGHVAQQAGFRVTGIEPSPQMAEIARRQYGLNIRQDILEHIELRPCSFDMITLWGTDSHFLNPREGFAALARALKPGGVLAMNYQDFSHWIRLLLPGIKRNWNALFLLNRTSLSLLFDSLKLERIYHKTEWQWTTLSHVLRVAKLPCPRATDSLVCLLPALSFPMVVARKAAA